MKRPGAWLILFVSPLTLVYCGCQSRTETVAATPERGSNAGSVDRRPEAGARNVRSTHGDPAPRRIVFQGYVLQNLGTLGGRAGEAWSLNGAGQVVGQARTSRANVHAFRFGDRQIKDLGALPGSDYSAARDINRRGQVVGLAADAGGTPRAVRFANGQLHKLHVPGGGGSEASATNDRGQIVGAADTPSPGAGHAVLWPPPERASRRFPWMLPDTDDSSLPQDLGTLGGTSSHAYGINAAGDVVGSAATAAELLHAFLYRKSVMTDLGTLGGPGSEARAINDAGHVVGWATSATGARRAFLFRGSRMRDLGTLGGRSSAAYAINSSGEVVGEATITDGSLHAFLFRRRAMIDLNRLLPDGSGWVLETASDINDQGQIVGSGLWRGEQRGFLLTLPHSRPGVATPRP